MKKTALFLLLAAAPLGAASAEPAMEEGFAPGSLGVAAIDRGDWAAAERALMKHRGLRADNPARLINLGKVYMETGRPELATLAWQKALESRRHFNVATLDGRYVSTKELAEQALARYRRDVASAR